MGKTTDLLGQMTERQIYIFGRPFTLHGLKGDAYFEEHLKSGAEQDLLSVMAGALHPDDWVVDVGANIGYIASAASALCPDGKVFAFEPASDTYKLLTQNSCPNVKVVNMGLSDSVSNAKLTYSQSNSSGAFVNENVVQDSLAGHASDTVKLRKLDDEYKKLGIKKCALLKVDIEGHEPNFLKGAAKFINHFKPLTIIEANHWCLNVFSRMNMPEFIELLFEYFPYIYAFKEDDYLDLNDKDARYLFFYHNTVNNTYMNLLCGFENNVMLATLNSALPASGLRQENNLLHRRVHELEQELQLHDRQLKDLSNSRPQRLARKLNKLAGR